MSISCQLDLPFFHVTTKTRLAHNPPSSQDILCMKAGCKVAQTVEEKIRLLAMIGVVSALLCMIMTSVSWGVLGLAMLLTAIAYFAVVAIAPSAIGLFHTVSFEVDGIQMVDTMNKRLFTKTHFKSNELAMSNLAKTYYFHVKEMKREFTVFDKYVIYLLNEDSDVHRPEFTRRLSHE